jgi:membrane protein YdbS with pleckstrin-like domain
VPENTKQIEDLQELVNLIQEHPELAEFRANFKSPGAIPEFARQARFASFEQGNRVFQQGEPGNEFVFVMQGQLRAVDVGSDRPKLLSYFTDGAIVGERAMLSNTVRTATVEVVTYQAKLAFFRREAWDWLMSYNPQFQTFFKELETSRLHQSQVEFPGKQPDEVVVASTKRHVLAFIATLPLPLTILIAPIILLIIAEILGIGLVAALNEILIALLVLPLVLIAAAILLYNYLDWRNDDFIVTTKRVIHIERFLFFAETRRDAPLTRIQDVTVVSGILDVLVDADDLRVTTAGTGVINFNNARKAGAIRQAIFRERERAKARTAAADTAAVRGTLAGQLGWDDKIEQNVMAVAESEGTIIHQPKTRHFNPVLDYLIPRSIEVNEGEDGTMIVWRKHLLLLFFYIFLPVLAFIISSYLFLASFVTALPPFYVRGSLEYPANSGFCDDGKPLLVFLALR